MSPAPKDSPPRPDGTATAVESRATKFEAAVLAMIPVVLLAVDPNWIFSSLFHDPWIYYGYYLDPARMIARFDGLYYGTRLSVILPGYLAHRVFPPVAAHLALHLTLYWTSLFSVYYLARAAVGRRSAFLASLVMATSSYFLGAIGHDYCDSFGIAYYTLASALTLSAARAGRGPLRMAVAGACVMGMVTANLAYVVLLPLPVLLLVAARGPRRWKGLFSDGFAFVASAALVFTGFGLYYCWLTGRFWFLFGSLEFLKANSRFVTRESSPFKRTDPEWVLWASWLTLPWAVVVWAWPRAFSWLRPPRWPDLATFYVLVFTTTAAGYVAVEVGTGFTLLQPWYYASLLIPLATLSFAALVARFADTLSPVGYLTTAVAMTALLVLSAAIPWPYDPSPRWPLPVIVITLIPAVAALAAFIFLPRVGLAGVAAAGLLAFSQFAARATFNEGKSVPDYDRFSPSFAYRIPPASPRLPPYAARAHQYDPVRKDVLLAIDDVVRFVRDQDPTNDVRYWFDMGEPNGVLFDNILCTRNFGWSLLNFNFPILYGDRVTDGPSMGQGQIVAVLSSQPDPLRKAVRAFGSIRFEARPLAHKDVRRGPLRFTVDLVELRRP